MTFKLQVAGKSIIRYHRLIVICIIAFVSCNVQKPANSSAFIAFEPSKGWFKNTTVVFDIDVDSTHSSSVCNLVFTLQITETYNFKREDSLRFALTFYSPQNHTYTDTLSVPILIKGNNVKQHRNNGVIELEIPYASNIHSMEQGSWEIRIDKCNLPESSEQPYKHLIGIGAYIIAH